MTWWRGCHFSARNLRNDGVKLERQPWEVPPPLFFGPAPQPQPAEKKSAAYTHKDRGYAGSCGGVGCAQASRFVPKTPGLRRVAAACRIRLTNRKAGHIISTCPALAVVAALILQLCEGVQDRGLSHAVTVKRRTVEGLQNIA